MRQKRLRTTVIGGFRGVQEVQAALNFQFIYAAWKRETINL